ncbi:MAG: cytochrome b/b6 domain-containing protein [Gammaproteobacteria bacterium]
MGALLDRLAARQHLLLALLSAWLILTSPWVHMFRGIPRHAGMLDYAHITLGLVALGLAVTYTISCTRQSGWRVYFPWLAGEFGQVGRDLRGLARGEIPAVEGGGLFALLEGLLLLALLATGVTGAAWLLLEGTAEAVRWRDFHIIAARGMIAVLVLHIVSVSLHLLEFIRE